MLIKSGNITLIMMFCSLLGIVKGSCLEYGHSCWGAHGKRSAPPTKLFKYTPKDSSITLLQLFLDKNVRYNLKIEPDETQKNDFSKDRRLFHTQYMQSSEEEKSDTFKKSVPTKRPYSNIYGRIISETNPDDEINNVNPDDTPDARLFKNFNNKY